MKKIMFNDAYGLTQATIDGWKTSTRRVEFNDKEQTQLNCYAEEGYVPFIDDNFVKVCDFDDRLLFSKPTRYKVGEVVAVAQPYKKLGYGSLISLDGEDGLHTGDRKPISELPGWTNKMFVRASLMHSCIRITGIRIEHLQDISDEDCIKEGLEWKHGANTFYVSHNRTTDSREWLGRTPREAFANLIDKVSGRGTWASNPWVVAYEYELVK